MSHNVQTKYSENALPFLTNGSPGAAGVDLASAEATSLNPGERRAISTGVAMALPEGTYGKIEGRSGHAVKYGIIVGGGVIDNDYRGEIAVILINTGDKPFVINKGDRIAQLIIQPSLTNMMTFSPVDELPPSARGTKGFGSSGTGPMDKYVTYH